MKKLLVLVLALTMIMSIFTGCGNNEVQEPSTSVNTEVETPVISTGDVMSEEELHEVLRNHEAMEKGDELFSYIEEDFKFVLKFRQLNNEYNEIDVLSVVFDQYSNGDLEYLFALIKQQGAYTKGLYNYMMKYCCNPSFGYVDIDPHDNMDMRLTGFDLRAYLKIALFDKQMRTNEEAFSLFKNELVPMANKATTAFYNDLFINKTVNKELVADFAKEDFPDVITMEGIEVETVEVINAYQMEHFMSYPIPVQSDIVLTGTANGNIFETTLKDITTFLVPKETDNGFVCEVAYLTNETFE